MLSWFSPVRMYLWKDACVRSRGWAFTRRASPVLMLQRTGALLCGNGRCRLALPEAGLQRSTEREPNPLCRLCFGMHIVSHLLWIFNIGHQGAITFTSAHILFQDTPQMCETVPYSTGSRVDESWGRTNTLRDLDFKCKTQLISHDPLYCLAAVSLRLLFLQNIFFFKSHLPMFWRLAHDPWLDNSWKVKTHTGLEWLEYYVWRGLPSIFRYSEINHRFFSVFPPMCFPRGLFPGLENCIERFLKTVSYSFSRTPKLLLLAGLPGPASVAWLNECNPLKTSLHNRKLLSLFPAQQATLP